MNLIRDFLDADIFHTIILKSKYNIYSEICLHQQNENIFKHIQAYSREGLKFFYMNADQLVNKRDELVMLIAEDNPDVILITEVPTQSKHMDKDGYKPLLNFEPDDLNLGASGKSGVAIILKRRLV